MTLQFYTNVVKGLKGNVRKFLGLISTFVEVSGEKLVEPSILDSVKRNRLSLGFKEKTKRRYVYATQICAWLPRKFSYAARENRINLVYYQD